MYLECRVSESERSGVQLVAFVPAAEHNRQAPVIEALFAGFEPGSGEPAQARFAPGWFPTLDDASMTAAFPGVDGAGYESPSYGYSLAWMRNEWTVLSATSEEQRDTLVLANAVSELTIEGHGAYEGAPTACIREAMDELRANSAINRLAIARGADGRPLRGQAGMAVFVVLSYVRTEEGGTPVDEALYVGCRPLSPGGGMLRVFHRLPGEDYERQEDTRDGVLRQLGLVTPPGSGLAEGASDKRGSDATPMPAA